ncbi:hypothetical protein DICPUDRAFT_151263 [Dictyostelium purpureum]|uniref:Uncharacterized protein n=1 Tax=Dictyostelium purpureum TaxID=5786 RepID=F0ZIE6_DICPU|nr:uncharacterized protein DICPUDRAFT_151263 [Dictyostelium purpureum]EGC36312.1 hypothetical protein DICPUDRAFT_151263 [Dictyostelium purpureum]|eukprot:XP_003287190.1 hypothetical protein DICPUDRAFT_151263 [Dictyostelium purpureum]
MKFFKMFEMESFQSKLDGMKKSLRAQIFILTLIGWAVALSIDRTIVNDYRIDADNKYSNEDDFLAHQDLIRSRSDKIALTILAVFETLLFGLGIGFFVAVGFRVFKIRNNMLRKRMIWCWGCISFFMISWWPHSTSHSLVLSSSGNHYDNYIAIEVSFHWTILFCSLTLSFFQYDLILLMFEVAMMKKKMETRKECNPLKMDWKYNFKYHALVFLFLFFSGGLVIMFVFDELKSDMEPYQKFFFITFKLVDSIILGCAAAFTYIASRIIYLLPPSNGKKVAIISSFCIAFLFFVGYGHPLAHTHSPSTMKTTVIIDYTIHLPIIITTGILAFYQFRMLELSTDTSSSLCMAAKLRNRPHKYSFPIRSLGIKSGAGATNISIGVVNSSESKYSGTPEHTGEYTDHSAITTDEKPIPPTNNEAQSCMAIEMDDMKKSMSDNEEMQQNSGGVSVDIRASANEQEINIERSSEQPNVPSAASVNPVTEIEINNEDGGDDEILPTEHDIDEFMDQM